MKPNGSMISNGSMKHVCNARLRNRSSDLEKVDVGPWAGEGYCRRRAGWGTDGDGRCKNHGGASPRGEAAPGWIDGRHSKYRYRLKPETLRAEFLRFQEEPDWLSLKDDAALVATRIQLLLDELEGPPPDFRELARAIGETRNHLELGATQLALAQLKHATEILSDGMVYHRIWEDVSNWIEARRKLVDSGQKQLQQLHAMLKLEDVMGLLAHTADAVRQAVDLYVTQPDERERVVEYVAEKLLIAAEERETDHDRQLALMSGEET